jgi:hypothetical protein
LLNFIKHNTKKVHIITGSYQFRRNDSSHDLNSQSVKVKMLVA